MLRSRRTIRLPWRWGSGVAATVPDCFERTDEADVRIAVRAVAAAATPETLFLWLCQLRRAPYSYDWIDNFGRRSPRDADPSMTKLRHGQSFMTIFALIDFVAGRSLTLQMKPGWPEQAFGAITVHYDIAPTGPSRSMLRATLRMPRIGVRFGGMGRYLLAWGDLLMMRKQLHVLAELAETAPSRRVAVRRP